MLQVEPLLAKIIFDLAENELSEVDILTFGILMILIY